MRTSAPRSCSCGEVGEDELREWVRARLRSTRVPGVIDVRTELPYNETGKLLRRVLKAEVARRDDGRVTRVIAGARDRAAG